MPVLPKTPSRAASPTRCDGLILQGGSKSKSIARLRAAVEGSLKGRWRINLISHRDRLYELIRSKPKAQPTSRQAFDLVRSLERHAAVAIAEIGANLPGVRNHSDKELESILGKHTICRGPKHGNRL